MVASITNNSVQSFSFICTQLNGYKYYNLITNNSIQRYSFIGIQFNGSKYCYVISIIQFRLLKD